MGRPRRLRFSLAELVVRLVFLSCTMAVGVQIHHALQWEQRNRDCGNNLRQLENYLALYTSGYSVCPPTCPVTSPPGGSGAPVPAGPNGAFWSWLYRVPSQSNAVSKRPGDDSLYVCPVCSPRTATSTAMEYTAPNLAATWPPEMVGSGDVRVYPQAELYWNCVRPEAPIGGDLIGPDRPNHGGTPGSPGDDWNMLCFDGSVVRVDPGSALHRLYSAATAGVRTT